MKNSKNKKIIIALAIGIVAAIIASILVVMAVSSQKVTMYVFKNAYEAGTEITGEMFTPVQVDSRVVVAGGGADTSDAFITKDTFTSSIKKGDVLKCDVAAGTPLMKSLIATSGNNKIEVSMDPKSVAITIPVNNVTGVTSTIKPESHVNVYATYNSGGTYLLLENVRVLNVDTKDNTLTGITLELDNEKAIKVINAANGGKLYCGLVNGNGYIYVDE